MSITLVITHATGDVFPATDWNTYLRDNINYELVAGSDLVAAVSIIPTNRVHVVSGVTTIDNLSPAAPVKGQTHLLYFANALTIRNNGGGTGNIRTRTGADLAVAPNQVVQFVYDGTVWREMSGGMKILQAVSTNYATLTATTSTTYVDSGLSVSITPKSTASKFWVFVSVNGLFSVNGNGVNVGLTRSIGGGADTVLAVIGKRNSVGNNGGTGPDSSTGGGSAAGMIRDTPASALALVYKARIAADTWNGSGQTVSAQIDNSNSTMLVLEVAE